MTSRTAKYKTLVLFSVFAFCTNAGWAGQTLTNKPMDPTDAAFAALLSMPGAEPETGEWNFLVPESFGEQTEKNLLQWLAKKKREGANFNAYRHKGTLLHHALRSRLEDTALWLIKNGADPRLEIRGSYGSAMNTVDLAASREMKKVVAILQKPPYAMSMNKHATSARNAPVNVLALPPKQEYLTPALVRQLIFNLYTTGYIDQSFLGYDNVLSMKQKDISEIPSNLFPLALENDETLKFWMGWISTLKPKDFSNYLNKVPDALFKTRTNAILAGMALRGKPTFLQEGRNPVDPANWKLLLEKLPKSFGTAGYLPVLSHTDTEFWPHLFSRGYVIHKAEEDLSPWLSKSKLEDVKKLWPVLLANSPTIKGDGVRLLMRNFSSGMGECRWEWTTIQQDVLNKVNYLIEQGSGKPRVELNVQCMRHSKPEIISSLVTLGAIAPYTPPAKPRFVVDEGKVNCKFSFTDAYYDALYRGVVINSGTEASWVSLIEIPGEEACGLLVAGDQSSYSYERTHDEFTGPEEDPYPSCPGPFEAAEVWHLDATGKIERLDADPVAALKTGMLRDTSDNHKYILSYSYAGRCSSDNGYLLDWRIANGKKSLVALNDKDPVWIAFLNQVDPSKLPEYPPFKAWFPTEQQENSTSADAMSGGGIPMFLNAYRQVEHDAYIKAIMDLDKPALKPIESRGIPAWWTNEALRLVVSSNMEIPDKRKRLAWIFKNHNQLRISLSSDILEMMIPWLPREDWWPILKVWGGLGYLSSSARRLGNEELACDADHAAGLMCGETLSPGMPN